MKESNERFTDAWTNHHRFLLDVAYRLLGSYSDAEDLVQEAFSRLLRTDLDPIEDIRAWLVVVVSRLCLDQLRSARVKREAYIGPWFPEPLLFSEDASTDPADVVTMDESVRFALLVVLERMSPAERVVFVLHDVFDFPFEKIAPMVGRTVAACRQLASRGKKLLPMLDPSVVGWADLGGGRTLPGVSRPNVGRDMVGDRVMRFFGAASGNQLVAKVINGEPSVVAFFEGAVASVLALSVSDGLISRIYVVSDPRKLAQVKRMLEQQN